MTNLKALAEAYASHIKDNGKEFRNNVKYAAFMAGARAALESQELVDMQVALLDAAELIQIECCAHPEPHGKTEHCWAFKHMRALANFDALKESK